MPSRTTTFLTRRHKNSQTSCFCLQDAARGVCSFFSGLPLSVGFFHYSASFSNPSPQYIPEAGRAGKRERERDPAEKRWTINNQYASAASAHEPPAGTADGALPASKLAIFAEKSATLHPETCNFSKLRCGSTLYPFDLPFFFPCPDASTQAQNQRPCDQHGAFPAQSTNCAPVQFLQSRPLKVRAPFALAAIAPALSRIRLVRSRCLPAAFSLGLPALLCGRATPGGRPDRIL